MKKAIVTVIGQDRVGIIAEVSVMLAGCGINVLDISQTLLLNTFTMVMRVDVAQITVPFAEVKRILSDLGERKDMSVRIQREDIFQAMHTVS